MTGPRRLFWAFALFICLVMPGQAHDARPVFVDVQQLNGTDYAYRLRVPPDLDAANRPVVQWTSACTVTAVPADHLRCSDPAAVPAFALVYPQHNPALALVVRLKPLQGEERWQVLPPDQLHWTAPAVAAWPEVLQQYLQIGVLHIALGIDHLLFVLGLLMLATTLRGLFIVVTGFTAAHSVTLALAALGVVAPPVAATEAVIALSLMLLAYELGHAERDSLTRRRPALVAAGFGLLHGLGFALALGELGLPVGRAVPALAAFNVGVELGQLLFIGLVAAAVLAIRQCWPAAARWHRSTLQKMAAYLIGMPASWWFIDRVQAIFG